MTGDFQALSSWTSPTALNSLSHHVRDPRFVSASSAIQLWDVTRGNDSSGRESGALRTMEWGAESINCVRFNMAETEVLASAGSDRGIVLYDLRSASPLTKMIMSVSEGREHQRGRSAVWHTNSSAD